MLLHWCQFSRGGNGSHLEGVNWCIPILINQCQHHWRDFARIVHGNIYDKLLNKIADVNTGGGGLSDIFKLMVWRLWSTIEQIHVSKLALVFLCGSIWFLGDWFYNCWSNKNQPKSTVFKRQLSKCRSTLFTTNIFIWQKQQSSRSFWSITPLSWSI